MQGYERVDEWKEDEALAINIHELNRLKNYEYFWNDLYVCKKVKWRKKSNW